MKTSAGEIESCGFIPVNLLREQNDIIRSRLFLLEKNDKIIMSMYLESKISCRQIALLLGVNRSKVSRRIKKITHELTKGAFISCMKKNTLFTPGEIAIAHDYFIKGLSIKQIAEKGNASYYQIREKLKEIQLTANTNRKGKR